MTVETFNYIESILWFLIAAVLFIRAIFNKDIVAYKTNMLTASALFLAFGVSDLIEVQTGTWWQPVELLIFKAACIIGFIFCLFKYLEIKKNKT